jgi:hypothetical protein
LFQIVSNNLSGLVTSISIGNYEPWTLGDYDTLVPSSTITVGDIALARNWKYFDMSLFPSPAQSVIKLFLDDPFSFKISDNVYGSIGNDFISTKLGDNFIYLKGGFDVVNSSSGNDAIYLSKTHGVNLKFQYGVWVTDPNKINSDINVDLGNNVIYSVKFKSSELNLNSDGYWDYNSVNLTFPSDTKLEKIVFSLQENGFAHIANIYINNIKIDSAIGTHTKIESWSSPEWVVNSDKYTFDLSSFIKNNYQGKMTVIDGGVGVDKIYFENKIL